MTINSIFLIFLNKKGLIFKKFLPQFIKNKLAT